MSDELKAAVARLRLHYVNGVPMNRVWSPMEVFARVQRETDAQQVIGQYFSLTDAIERSGLDLTCCMMCGELVVAIPDGLPMCEPCARNEAAGQ